MSSLAVKDVDFGEHGVIYISSEKDRPVITEWTKPATAELLRVLPKLIELFNNRKIPSKRSLYDNCSVLLGKKGFNYTSSQCENKWKSLKRRYLTKREKVTTGKRLSQRKQMFDDSSYFREIEAALKVEKPSFKREMDEISKVNLNIPPGFSLKTEKLDTEDEEDYYEDYEEYADTGEQDYTQNDEKLVKMVLKDSDGDSLKDNKNNIFTNNIEYLYPNGAEEAVEYSEEEKYTPFRNNSRIVREIKELRKSVKRSLDTNTQILKTHNATHEQLLISLDTLDKREEEKLKLKRQKLEKQGELIQQMKIQNSLIAKLIQKLGSSSSSNR